MFCAGTAAPDDTECDDNDDDEGERETRLLFLLRTLLCGIFGTGGRGKVQKV